MAPEVLRNTNNAHYDGKRADIWSCGVVLYTMLVGSMPFNWTGGGTGDNLGASIMRLLDDMREQRFLIPSSLHPAAGDLVRRLLHPDPAQRISVADVTSHPWFSVGLPANALSMNETYLRLPRSCAQSEEEIRAIVARAALAHDSEAPCHGGQGEHLPEHLPAEPPYGMAA